MKKRVALSLPVLVLSFAAFGQDQGKLRNYYGDPVGEVFHVGDDLILTTSLDAHKNVCSLRIEHQSHGRRLTDAELNVVVERVAPQSDRGGFVMGTFLNVICLPDNDCAGVSENYTKLSITKIGSTNEYRHVTVRYHRPECDVQIQSSKSSGNSDK